MGDDLAVLGTNFGQPKTPAWVLNLEAEPRATVAYKQRTVAVVARPASEDEAREVMERSRAIYGGYEKYAAAHQRSPGADLRARAGVIALLDQVPGRGTTGRTVTSGIVASAGRSSTCNTVETTVSGLIHRDAS